MGTLDAKSSGWNGSYVWRVRESPERGNYTRRYMMTYDYILLMDKEIL